MENTHEATAAASSVQYLPLPDKSENDKKLYKYLVLPNGLKVLLISDNKSSNLLKDDEDISSNNLPKTDQADEKLSAVALMVDVGAFSQPRNYQGLAHFLEHMIFMGSKKYPNENSFDTHLTKYGGSNNAFTDGEETLYYFEVAEKHLDSSMDCFAAQLKEPLLIEDSMTRERQAVESEFQLILNNDTIRCNQIMQSLASENYPHESFIWGNLKSLKEEIESDEELHRNLHKFYKRHYSSHRMYACIQSCLPLEKLEELAIKHFADMPNNELPGLDFEQYNYKEAFRPEFYKEVFFVKPVENTCQLNLTWILPCTLKMYKCKPALFLTHFLGFEGEGSLCAYFRKRLWALELNCGAENSTMYNLLYININLTDLGFKHLDEVLQASFAYIKLLNKACQLEEYYKEISYIKNSKFRYSKESTPSDNVIYLAKCLKCFAAKDILTGPELYYKFDEQQVQLIIDHLNEFNFNIMLTSYQNYEGVVYDKKEKWFGTDYTTREIPQNWLDMWQRNEEIPELHLPKPNVFVAKDFRIFWLENGKKQLSPIPEKLMQTELGELWFRQDDKFLLPHAYMHFHMMSSVLRKSARNPVIGSLYLDLVQYYLEEELYPASEAGITHQIYCGEKGVVLSVDGFNEKLDLVLEIMMKALISTKDRIDENQLEIFKKQQQKSFYNSLLKPDTINTNLNSFVLKETFWMLSETYKYIKDISLQDIQIFAEEFSQEVYVQALIQGNVEQETAFKAMDLVLQHLNCGEIKEKTLMDDRAKELPLGAHKILCRNLNPKDCNTLVTNFYQIGVRSLRQECILDLLIMILEAPLYNVLRTQQQLGYSVCCFKQINHGIMGFYIYVASQETKHSAAHVEERIEAFRGDIQELLEKLSLEDFENFKNSLIKLLEIKDVTLDDEVNRNWSEITCEEYLFQRKSKSIEILRSLKKQDILDFWSTNEETNLRKLSVQVIGVNKTPEECKAVVEEDVSALKEINLEFLKFDENARTIVNVQEFKDKLYVYPVTKTQII